MLGCDYYGDWSAHYHMWNSRESARGLLVRFEELVNANSALLDELRGFVGYAGEVKSFVNRMHRLHFENAKFFNGGAVSWSISDKWTQEEVAIFISRHGALLEALGYINSIELEATLQKLNVILVRLAEIANASLVERNSWHLDAQAKEKVIQLLLANPVDLHSMGVSEFILRRIKAALNRFFRL